MLVRKVGEMGEVDGKTTSCMLGVYDWDDQSDTCVDIRKELERKLKCRKKGVRDSQ